MKDMRLQDVGEGACLSYATHIESRGIFLRTADACASHSEVASNEMGV